MGGRYLLLHLRSSWCGYVVPELLESSILYNKTSIYDSTSIYGLLVRELLENSIMYNKTSIYDPTSTFG